jgi:hypothetical protein
MVLLRKSILHPSFIFLLLRGLVGSAGCDDTASMIEGGSYVGARTRQPPTA